VSEIQTLEIRPQPGPQEAFLASPADIAIYGGSAFSGKSYALLMDRLRAINIPGVSAVCFRRETPQIKAPGGLWEESSSLYGLFGALAFDSKLEHHFPGGLTVKFAHLEREKDVRNWDGPQVPILLFDQLEAFTRYQFFYMLSRNRDPSGKIRPYVRATCNPDAGSWLATFVSWWIADDGFADLSRAGVLRWFVRQGDDLIWGDTREQLLEMGHGDPALALDHPEQPWLSVAYIPGTIYDNKIGMSKDPGYLAKLKSLDMVERMRLLGDPKRGGNWKIKAAAGLLFQRTWLTNALPALPLDVEWIRGWDLAGTKKIANNDPDWTVGVLLGRYRGGPNLGRFVIGHAERMQESPHVVEDRVFKTAQSDPHGTSISGPQDPGQAGKAQAGAFTRKLSGFDVRFTPESGDKETRFRPFSAQAEAGNVDYVIGAWNDAFFSVLENFPEGPHDDDCDAVSRAFNAFHGTHTGFLEYARRELERRKKALEERAQQLPQPGGVEIADMGALPGANAPLQPEPEKQQRPRNSFGVSAGVKTLTQRQAGPKPMTVAEREAEHTGTSTTWPTQ